MFDPVGIPLLRCLKSQAMNSTLQNRYCQGTAPWDQADVTKRSMPLTWARPSIRYFTFVSARTQLSITAGISARSCQSQLVSLLAEVKLQFFIFLLGPISHLTLVLPIKAKFSNDLWVITSHLCLFDPMVFAAVLNLKLSLLHVKYKIKPICYFIEIFQTIKQCANYLY